MMFYGQHEPPVDQIIAELMPPGLVGTAIDVGAGDGIVDNNTLHFEENGWRVLCVEPQMKYLESLGQRRKLFRMVAVSNHEDADAPFHVFNINGRFGGVSGLQPDEKLITYFKEQGYYWGREECRVPVLTLNRLCDECGFTSVELLSIDTEGTELDVLKGFDLGRFRPSVIVVENNWDEDCHREYLKSFGYKFVRRNVVNDFYVPA